MAALGEIVVVLGIVYRATRSSDGKPVAVKVPLPHYDPLQFEFACQQIRTEAKLLQEVAGPGIPEVYSLVEHNGLPAVAMEFLDGPLLSELPIGSDEEKRIVASYLADVSETLDRVHAKGLIHRDLKSSNILICNGNAYLIDFGIGLDEQSQFNEDTRQAGSLETMSPESLLNMTPSLGGRSDLWAIGSMLKETFGGEPAPDFKNKEEAFVASLLGDMPGATEDGQPATGIGWIIERCLHRDPNRRFETGRELAAALRAWLRGEDPSEAVEQVGMPILLWRLGMKGSFVLRSLSSSRRAAVSAKELVENGENASQARNELGNAIGFAHGAICLFDELKTANPLVEIELPKDVAAYYRGNFYRSPDASLEEAAKLVEYADLLMNAAKQVLRSGYAAAQKSEHRTERLYTFAVAVNGVIQTDESLDAIADGADLPALVWQEPAQIIRTTDDPKTADKELQRLTRRVELFLQYGTLPKDDDET